MTSGASARSHYLTDYLYIPNTTQKLSLYLLATRYEVSLPQVPGTTTRRKARQSTSTTPDSTTFTRAPNYLDMIGTTFTYRTTTYLVNYGNYLYISPALLNKTKSIQ